MAEVGSIGLVVDRSSSVGGRDDADESSMPVMSGPAAAPGTDALVAKQRWLVRGLLVEPLDASGDSETTSFVVQEGALAGRDTGGMLVVALLCAEPPRAALSRGEARVLSLLPTQLSAREIAGRLGVSVNTVKTHMRKVYAKLGAHRRTEAVELARARGMLDSAVAEH